uniref:tRNA(Phe) (4-demethylwyosine(37)-C(7)) aminocarboxypropyltransferase n=1 Tax=Aplanochytrium stocchinoi TaxID=215587 RepID=A0A7S3LGP3_9STRA
MSFNIELHIETYQGVIQFLNSKTRSIIISIGVIFAGADVIACEMNEDVARIAERMIKENNLSHKIKVIYKRSTDLNEADLGKRLVDIIVTETLDSQLLAEGILPTINHAREYLSTPQVVTIPQSATVYMHLCDIVDDVDGGNRLQLETLRNSSLHLCSTLVSPELF